MDEGIPISNKMDEGIRSESNRAQFQQQDPAHVQIMNMKRNTRVTITAIMQQNAAAEIALLV